MAKKLDIIISGDALSMLEKLGNQQGREHPAVLRRAIATYAYMQQNYRGQTIIIKDERGKQKSLYIN